MRTTYGTVAFEHNIAERDDVLVTRLREAGAIMVGKTTTPEFGIKGTTEGPIFGVTRNPWDLSRTPGGSSGGAGRPWRRASRSCRSAAMGRARPAGRRPAAAWSD